LFYKKHDEAILVSLFKGVNMAFVLANKVVILAALLSVSEVLAAVPSIKANSVFGLVVNALKAIAGK
jgi:hypothetical protein